MQLAGRSELGSPRHGTNHALNYLLYCTLVYIGHNLHAQTLLKYIKPKEKKGKMSDKVKSLREIMHFG